MKKIITGKHLRSILLIMLFAFSSISVYAWQGEDYLYLSGSGNTAAANPPGLANDGAPGTYTSFKPGLDGWIKIGLDDELLIQGLRLNADVPDSVWLSVGYEQDGKQKVFPSGYVKGETGEFIIDISSLDVITDKLSLNFHGNDLKDVKLYEIEVTGQNPDSIYYRKDLKVKSASAHTSYHMSEYELIDGYAGTYWAIRCSEDWGKLHWFVQDQLKKEKTYNRTYTLWKQGYAELEMKTPSAADTFKIYIKDDAHGTLDLQLKYSGSWHSLDTLTLDNEFGWKSYDISSFGIIEGIKLNVQGNKNEIGGIGEIEIWGSGDYQGSTSEDLLSPSYSNLDEEALFFSIDDVDFTSTYKLSAVYTGLYSSNSGILLNGESITPESSVTSGDFTILNFTVLPGQLWTGDNFIKLISGSSDEYLSVHLRENGNSDQITTLGGKPADGLLLSGAFGNENGEAVFDGSYDIQEITVYHDGTSPGSVYQKTSGAGYQIASKDSGFTYTENVEQTDGRSYLNVKENNEGYITYFGNGTADTLGFTSGSGVTEIIIKGSKTEDGFPFARMQFPAYLQSLQKNEIGYKAVFGITDSADSTIKLNGKKAKNYGNIFYSNLNSLQLNNFGVNTINVDVTDAQGRQSEYESSLIIQSDSYQITLDQGDNLYYTRDDSFIISGKANKWTNNLFINGQSVSIGNNKVFSHAVPLSEGINIIELNFTDKHQNKTVAWYLKKVYKYSGDMVIDIQSPSDGIYINENETYVSGFARGAGLESVTINGFEAQINGSYFRSTNPVVLSNEENIITVTATDKTGFTTSKTISVYRDLIPPEISNVSPVNGTWFNESNVTFTGIATDDNTCSVFVNGHMALKNGDNFLVDVDLAEGSNTIQVMATDLAGNVARYAPFIVKIDTTPPESFDITVDPDGWTNNRQPEISFSTADTGIGISHYEVSVNGQNFTNQSSPVKMPFLDDGENVVSVKVYDFLQNVRIEQATMYIDTLPPDVPSNFNAVPGSDNVEIKWTEDNEDDETVKYILTSSDSDLVEINRAEGETLEDSDDQFFSWNKESLSPGDEYSFSIKAVDHAGNISDVITQEVMIGVASEEYVQEEGAIVEYDSVALVIPKNSLPENIEEVLITETVSQDLEDKSFNPIVSPIYSFAVRNTDDEIQDHIKFEEKFIGALDYDETLLPDGLPEESLDVYYFDSMWSRWFKVEESGVDTDNNKIYFTTNHFTEFSIQPTVIEDLSPQELSDVEFSPFDTKIAHSPVSISPQGGAVTMSMTEFVLPGKNGLDFELRRIYDSATARADSMGLNINIGISIEDFFVPDVDQSIKAIELLKTGYNFANELCNQLDVKSIFLNNGDYSYALGQGWRLNLPYIRGANGGVLVRTPSGSFYNINAMKILEDELDTNGFERDVVFENHEGEDFTLKISQIRADLSSISQAFGPIGLPAWVLEKATLYTKDGNEYSFDYLGRLKYIRNKTNDKIVFEYDSLLLDKIIDTYGRVIKFKHSEVAEHSLIPQIEKISIEGDDRFVEYQYETQIGEFIGEDLPFSLNFSLPILQSSTDFGNRTWEYDYTSKFLFATSFSAEVNAVAAMIFVGSAIAGGPSGGAAINSALGISACSIRAGAQTEWIFPVKSIEGPGIGKTKVYSDVKNLDYLEIEGGDYFLGLFPTSISAEISMEQRNIYDKLQKYNNEDLLYEENYDFNFKYADHKQFYNSKTVVNDGRMITTYLYDKVVKKRNRWVDSSDQFAEGPFTENPVIKQVIPLNTFTSYADTSGNIFEFKAMTYDDNLRMKSERFEKSALQYTQTNYTYDKWGNKTKIDITDKSGNVSTHHVVFNQYQTRAIDDYSNPFTLPSLENEYIHDLLLGTVKTTEITGSEIFSDTLPVKEEWYGYNNLGQRTDVKKKIDDNKWSEQTFTYYPISDNVESAQINTSTTKMTDDSNQVTEFSYTQDASVYTVTQTHKDVLQANESHRDESSMTTYDLLTGNVKNQEDGRGNITSYEYDNLDRKIKVTKPGNDAPVTSIVYDDDVLTVTVTDPLLATSTYDFDDLGQLGKISKTNRYPSVETLETSLVYDGYGNITKVTDPESFVTDYIYDAKKRVLSETYINPDGADTSKSYTYNDFQNFKLTTNENGSQLKEYFDMRGNVIFKSDLDTSGNTLRTWQYIHDYDNQVLIQIEPNNTKTVLVYNAAGLPVSETHDEISGFDGVSDFTASYGKNYSYDKMGNKTGETESLTDSKSRVSAFSYNGLSRVLTETHNYTDSEGNPFSSTIKHFYDKAGNEERTIDGNGIETSREYSPRGQVTAEIDGEANRTSYVFDKKDRVTSMTGPRGNSGLYPNLDFSIEYVYDDLDRLIEGKLPKRPSDTVKPSVVLEYDKRNNLLTRTEPDGAVTSYNYNFRKWIDDETRSGIRADGTPVSYSTGYTYDKVGNKLTESRPIGTWTYTYDIMNRMTSETAPDSSVINYNYDVVDNMISQRDGNGFYTFFAYDDYNRMVKQTDSKHNETDFMYDLLGNRTKMIDSNGHSWKTVFDEMGRISKEINSRGKIAKYSYDPGGRLNTLTDPGGTEISYHYNLNGQPETIHYINTLKGLLKTESFIYDEGGAVRKATSVDGVVKTYNVNNDGDYTPDPYDMSFFVDLEIDSSSSYRTAYNYDKMNRQTSTGYSSGLSVNQTWNNLGQLEDITGYASGFKYNANGYLSEYSQGNGIKASYNFDTKSRLSSLSYTFGGSDLKKYDYGYDFSDNMTSRNEDQYAYDSVNQLIVASLTGDASVEEFTVPNPHLRHTENDVLGNSSTDEVSGDVYLDYGASSLIVDYGYPYRMWEAILTPSDINHRIEPDKLQIFTSMVDSEESYTENLDVTISVVDGKLKVKFGTAIFARFLKIHSHFNELNADRTADTAQASFMMSLNDPGSIVAKAIKSGRNEFYEYDDKGNRTKRVVMAVGIEQEELSYYENSDLLKTDNINGFGYQYDNNGNLIVKSSQFTPEGEELDIPAPGEIGFISTENTVYYSYEFDLKNRLKSVNKYDFNTNSLVKVSEYVYDIDGFRVRKTDREGLVTDFVFDTEGKVLDEVTTETTVSYVFMKSRHLARVEGAETLFYGTDHLGTTVVMTDMSGADIWSGDATPFGDIAKVNSDRDFGLKYTGKDLDEDAGLYYFNARWYDADTGRFISEDPIRAGSNWFIYVSNNPNTRIDPSGLYWKLTQRFMEGIFAPHHGEDWIWTTDGHNNLTQGMPVPTPKSGKVVLVGDNPDSDMGYFINIQDDSGMILSIQHGAEKSPLSKGDIVEAGDLVLVAGNTGNSTDSHVHMDYGTRDIPEDTSKGIVKNWKTGDVYYENPEDLDSVESESFNLFEEILNNGLPVELANFFSIDNLLGSLMGY